MANGNSNLLSENIDPNTWKGYVVSKLEDLSNDIKDIKSVAGDGVRKEDFERFAEKIDEVILKCQNCRIEEIGMAIFGDISEDKPGLLEKFSNLNTAFAIKSGIWAVIGSGITSAIMIAVYLVMRH